MNRIMLEGYEIVYYSAKTEIVCNAYATKYPHVLTLKHVTFSSEYVSLWNKKIGSVTFISITITVQSFDMPLNSSYYGMGGGAMIQRQ